MSGPRRHYSEKWANKPALGDQVRNTAVPLGRNSASIYPDKPLTPEKQEVSDKIRSYIRPDKNINTLSEPTRKRSKPEDHPFHETASKRQQLWKRIHLVQPLHKGLAPGAIGRIRHSVPPINSRAAIGQIRKIDSSTKPVLGGRGELKNDKGPERRTPLSEDALKRTEKNNLESKKGPTSYQQLPDDRLRKNVRKSQDPLMKASTSAKDNSKIHNTIHPREKHIAKSFLAQDIITIDSKSNTSCEAAANNLQPSGTKQFSFLGSEAFSKAIELFTTAINDRIVKSGDRWEPSIKLKSAKMRSLINEHRKSQASKRESDRSRQ